METDVNEVSRITCGFCGITFWVPRVMFYSIIKGKTFHCPNGHAQALSRCEGHKPGEQYRDSFRDYRLIQSALERRVFEYGRERQKYLDALKRIRALKAEIEKLKKDA